MRRDEIVTHRIIQLARNCGFSELTHRELARLNQKKTDNVIERIDFFCKIK